MKRGTAMANELQPLSLIFQNRLTGCSGSPITREDMPGSSPSWQISGMTSSTCSQTISIIQSFYR